MNNSVKSISEITELQFESPTHTYRLNGIIIPSVSTIMSPLSAAKYKGINDSVLSAAANKGTSIHNSIEDHIKFGIVDVDEEYEEYFRAYLKWNEEVHPTIIDSERYVYHKILNYAGTIDMLASIDDELCLIDIKTTRELIDMTCGVQLEAYAQALKTHGVMVQRKIIVQLKDNGEYVSRDYPVPDPERWRVFNSLKVVYDYIHSVN